MSNDHVYPVSYKIEHGQFTKADLDKLNRGGCDGIIIHSLLFPEDGSRSELIMSSDGKGQPLSDDEIFKSWVSLAKRLSESDTLGEERKGVARVVFMTIRELILTARGLPTRSTPA